MHTRDRVQEFRRVKASTLRPNPRNWRTHPVQQRQALRGILAEVGYADALLARQLEDGTLELIDGHLRAETTPDMEVPVLVLDVTAEEADKLLAVLDPLAALAEVNSDRLDSLAKDVQTDSIALQNILDNLVGQAQAEARALSSLGNQPALELETSWQLVVECRDEAQQQALYERLGNEGFKCRVLGL